MSVDKLVNSTQLDSDLTSVANAIRTKSGGSGQLAFPSGFVSEIGNIPSGGGGLAFDWANVSEITIGANSVTNTTGVQSYFSGYTYVCILLASSITTNNQFVWALSPDQNGTINQIDRYRDGSIRTTTVGNAYDCKLVEGTKYYLFRKS